MAPVTRGHAKITEEAGEEESILSSSNAVKRKSTGNDHDSDDNGAAPLEPASPKRQRLAVRTREDESTSNGRKTQLVVEIPVSTEPKRPRTDPVPDSQDMEGALESGPEAEPSSASKQLEEEATQRLSSQPIDQPSPAPKPKGKHLVFEDDNDVENFVAAAAVEADNNVNKEVEEVEEEEKGSGDDDDDAPEAVSTQAVAKEMQEAAHAASEAAEKQAASLKRKRQEKDNLYKQQAERRKRARATVEVHQNKATTVRERSSSEEEGREIAEVETAVTAGRRRAQKFNLPAPLPAEFLTDSSSEDEDDETTLKRVIKKPTKINFDALGNEGSKKQPRDRTMGTTRYRVLEDQADQKLAPRIQKKARVSKEKLLKRKRAGVVTNKKGGFFVKR
ncbi:hypothetical protein F4677DRAFT_429577 [Hypoxylon crocopeplum]|nr:hypothetical protein F4677DRAFT_429577 [Hypoxylon crocopeplum]